MWARVGAADATTRSRTRTLQQAPQCVQKRQVGFACAVLLHARTARHYQIRILLPSPVNEHAGQSRFADTRFS